MKKILFICGSLEPGHDGVGDYTRSLSGALILRNIEVRILALKDRSVKDVMRETQQSGGQSVEVLRLSKSLSVKDAEAEYLNLVRDFNPDLVSLQYVPYAYSRTGIPLYLPGFLKLKNANVKWHIMVHEAFIWDRPNMKLKLVAEMQKKILKRLVQKLQPSILHTSIPWYSDLLKKIGVRSHILPLFGNIEIVENVVRKRSHETVTAIFFGAGPLHESFSLFSNGIRTYLNNHEKHLTLTFCGRPDFRTLDFIAHLRSEISNSNFEINELGSQETVQLSELFQKSDFGISREAPRLMGKSGTVISMLEHGLPLWVPLSSGPAELKSDFGFRAESCFTDLNTFMADNNSDRLEAKNRLASISESFIRLLCDADTSESIKSPIEI